MDELHELNSILLNTHHKNGFVLLGILYVGLSKLLMFKLLMHRCNTVNVKINVKSDHSLIAGSQGEWITRVGNN